MDINTCFKNGLKFCIIPPASKNPATANWQKKPQDTESVRIALKNRCNIGVIHRASETCCFDIDNIEEAMKHPLLKTLLVGDEGLRWSSGTKNRIKILFKRPSTISKKKWRKVFLTHSLPSNTGQFRAGYCQDVFPPSTHPSGTKYEFIDNKKIVPELPSWIYSLYLKEHKEKRGSNSTLASSKYPHIRAYNKWFWENKCLRTEILALGTYSEVTNSLKGFHRKGSDNPVALYIYPVRDTDVEGEIVYNFSDTQGQGLLPYGVCDPYTILSVQIGDTAARQWVCTKLKTQVDKEFAKDKATHQTIRRKGILYKDDLQPYISEEILFPKGEPFTKLVKSILYHQEGVYNPDMAFWYSLVLMDFIIGGGYKPINGNKSEPIYCFTAGRSGDGKTTTMNSGALHLTAIGAIGNTFEGERTVSEIMGTDTAKRSYPKKDLGFLNKKVLKNIATSQGLEDLITSQLFHGCDVLFTQDEYGLVEKGTVDQSARTFRAAILDYKTLSRAGCVEPRLLARPAKDAAKQSPRKSVFCVHFNYFTTATEESLRGVIGDKEVGQGYIQRFIGGCSRSPHFKVRSQVLGSLAAEDQTIPKSVLKMLKQVLTVSNTYSGLKRVEKGVTVKVDEDAMKYLIHLTELSILNSTEELSSKLVENLQPVAKLRAICRNPPAPVVNLSDVKWAHTICSQSILYFRWLLGKLNKRTIPGNKTEAALEAAIFRWCLRIIDKGQQHGIDSTGWSLITISRYANLHKIGNSKEYTAALKRCIDMGVLQKRRDKKTKVGRPGNKYNISAGKTDLLELLGEVYYTVDSKR